MKTEPSDRLYMRLALRLLQGFGDFCPDTVRVRLLYRLFLGQWLDLECPISFNEKLQWLKLNWRPDNLNEYVDKVSAKWRAKEKCNEVEIIPTLGVWEQAGDIDFDSLPDSFILKASAGGGGNVWICRDKSRLDTNCCRSWADQALRVDVYHRYGEWCYRGIKSRILAEPLLGDGECPVDYKFFCFDGIPEFMKVDTGRFSSHRSDYYDLGFNKLDIGEVSYPASDESLPRPDSLENMVKIATALSASFPFVRVDLYETGGKVYFGEFTFFPRSGLGRLYPEDADLRIGRLLKLPCL